MLAFRNTYMAVLDLFGLNGVGFAERDLIASQLSVQYIIHPLSPQPTSVIAVPEPHHESTRNPQP